MNVIALVATLAVAALAWLWLQRQYRTKGRAHFAYLLLFALSIVAVVLAAIGKLHWLGAIAAATATALFRIGLLLGRWLLPRLGWLPLLNRYWQHHRQGQSNHGQGQRAGDSGSDAMDRRTALEILGWRAELLPSASRAGDVGEWLDGYLFALAGPIYAGTNEIQRNVIAERILGLPRS